MQAIKSQLESFFDDYSDRMNRALVDTPEVDLEATADAFANCFVEANPKGVTCGQNDDQFRQQIPKGIEFYRSIGTRSMEILWKQITPLDEFHSMVKAHWQAHYARHDGSRAVIDFDVIYFVQTLDDTPKIFAYITGDEQRVYRDHGLVPG